MVKINTYDHHYPIHILINIIHMLIILIKLLCKYYNGLFCINDMYCFGDSNWNGKICREEWGKLGNIVCNLVLNMIGIKMMGLDDSFRNIIGISAYYPMYNIYNY